jgi:uncharacterized membrane protein YhaH (DUF805 family)
MQLIRLFTSFSGRIGRRSFWFGILTLALIGGFAALTSIPNIFTEDPFKAVLKNWDKLGLPGLLISLALLYPAMAIVVKRLHDRNRGGYYAALFWAPALIRTIAAITGKTPFLEQLYSIATFLSYQMIAIAFWFFIELGFLGSKEPNKYGHDPRDT